MPPEFPHDDSRTALPDPLRHQQEIDEMEQRFRQRSDQPAVESPTTGMVDERVQEEMRQFFSESTQILAEVVPNLKRDQDRISDTTGEIRRKIDAFFGDAGMIRSERTMPIGAIDLQNVAALAESGPEPQAAVAAPAAGSLPRAAPAVPSRQPVPRAAPPAAPRAAPPAAPRAAPPVARGSAASVASRARALPPLRRKPPAAAAAPGGSKLDLKTALERLRRHGVVRDDPPTFATPAPAAAAPPPAPPPAPARRAAPAPRAAPRAAPAPALEPEREAAPARPREPAPVRVAEPEPQRPRVTRPQQVAPAPVHIDVPEAGAVPPRSAAPDDDPFAPAPSPPEPIRALPERPAPPPRTPPPPAPEPHREAAAAPLPPPLSISSGGGVSAIPRVEPISPTQESGEGFDEIFAEVEGLVRGTLADSVQETLEEARVAEDNMRSRVQQRPPTTENALSAKLPPPRDDDDDDDDEPEEEAPAGPYNWGVSAANRPAGAWLLDDGAEQAARSQVHEKARAKTGEITGVDVGGWKDAPVSPTQTEPSAVPDARESRDGEPRDADPPVAVEEPSTGSITGPGANGILARKLEAEAGRFDPIVDTLVAKGLVDGADLEEDDDDEFDDDDEVSVASFKDDRPRGDAMGVTPMRIIEEIRRLRRIQEVLLSKGLVSEAEIAAAAPSGD